MNQPTFSELQAVRLKVPDKKHPNRTKGLITGWIFFWDDLIYEAVWEDGIGCYLATELQPYAPRTNNDNDTLQNNPTGDALPS